MNKITAADPVAAHGPMQTMTPTDVWWVEGVLYTDDPGVITWAVRRGHLVEDAVGGEPVAHTAAVEQMREEARINGVLRPGGGTRDALAPGNRNYL